MYQSILKTLFISYTEIKLKDCFCVWVIFKPTPDEYRNKINLQFCLFVCLFDGGSRHFQQ
jgi:hypothetical protein